MKTESGKRSWSRMLPFSQVSLINTMSACLEQTRSWARSKLLTLGVPTLCYDFMLLPLITGPFNGTLEPPNCVLFVVVGPRWLIISPQSRNKPVMKLLEWVGFKQWFPLTAEGWQIQGLKTFPRHGLESLYWPPRKRDILLHRFGDD